MTEQNLIKLSDVEIIIDESNNNIYIDFKVLSLKIEEAFKTSKRLQSFFNKTIIFKFNGWCFEVTGETTIDQIKSCYEYQEQLHEEIHHLNHVKETIQKATNKLEESNVKSTVDYLTKELELDNPKSIFRPYISSYDQKQFASKLYKIYRENHNSEKIELLPPAIEIPKVMLKKNRQII